MRVIEYKICRKCKKMYRWESGGIVMKPQDHMDMGLCKQCRTKEGIVNLWKIFDKESK